MKTTSTIKLDKAAAESNWQFLREHFGNIKISAVVKGNAYGHGLKSYVPLAESCGVNHFSVYNAYEAYVVYDVMHKDSDLMIMGEMNDDDIAWAIDKGIEFYVFHIERLLSTINIAKQKGKKAKVHIELETGMYRTGFDASQLKILIDTMQSNIDVLTFRGLCMHFAGAESLSNYLRLKKQKIEFRRMAKTIKAAGLEPELIHTCCSAAAIRYPDMHYDMLRIGIMQYGFWPNVEVFVEYANKYNVQISPLRRVINWETYVMSIKHVPPGAFVGYGSSFFSHQPMVLAIIPLGYAHGFSRSLSNSGIALVHEWRCPVVGTVNMNCIAIDITTAPDVKIGDIVTLIGRQGEQEISVASFGEMSNQLNYELLTRLPHDINREVV